MDRIKESICPNCGKLIDTDSSYCKFCSSSLRGQGFKSYILSNVKNFEVIGIFAAIALLTSLDPSQNSQLLIVSNMSLLIIVIISVNVIWNGIRSTPKREKGDYSIFRFSKFGLEISQLFIFLISFSVLISAIVWYIFSIPGLNIVAEGILYAGLSVFLGISLVFLPIFWFIDKYQNNISKFLGIVYFALIIASSVHSAITNSPFILQLCYSVPLTLISLIGIFNILFKQTKKEEILISGF